MNDRHEARLLLSILDDRWEEARLLRTKGPVREEVFFELCRRCDVAAWVHAQLDSRHAFDLVGSQCRERLSAERRWVLSSNMGLLGRAEQAVGILLGEGIVPVAVKGLDFLHRLYGRPDERSLDDVDLLVAESDFQRAIAALEKAGYRLPPEPEKTHWLRTSFEIPLESPPPLPLSVDLHWDLGQKRRYRIEPGRLLERAAPLAVGPHRILRLEDHDAAAYLLVHQLKHYFDRRLKWAVDLGRLSALPGFDWNIVAERLREWGATVAGGFALLHLRKLLPDRFAGSAPRALPLSPLRRALAFPLRSGHPLDLFRGMRYTAMKHLVAAICFERAAELPGYLWHRAVREKRPGGPQQAR